MTVNVTSSTQPLSHEWQLGNQLNESVRDGEADQFRLLLAMLSEDVRDQAQFSKLKQESAPKAELRSQFELPEPQSFYAEECDLNGAEGATLANAEDAMALLLRNCLHPEPLTAPEVKGPGFDVMSTLSPLQQQKQREFIEPELKAEPELSWQQADLALLKMLEQSRLVA